MSDAFMYSGLKLNKTSITNVRNVFADPSGKETHYQFVVNFIDYVDGPTTSHFQTADMASTGNLQILSVRRSFAYAF